MAEESQRIGCLGTLLKLIGIKLSAGSERERNELPYRLRDNFLSAAELAFYRVLEQAVGDQYSVNNKVRLWDVLYVPQREDSRTHENKISSKHVDFLLCDRTTMKPVLAIELDDASHNRPDRQDRDAFVDQAFAAAGLPIIHVKAAHSYSSAVIQQQIVVALPRTEATIAAPPPLPPIANIPSCPKCKIEMVQRKASKGTHAGKSFWACTNYPSCREIIAVH